MTLPHLQLGQSYMMKFQDMGKSDFEIIEVYNNRGTIQITSRVQKVHFAANAGIQGVGWLGGHIDETN